MPLDQKQLSEALHTLQTKHNILNLDMRVVERKLTKSEKDRTSQRKTFNIFALISAFMGVLILLSDRILPFFISTNYDPSFGIIQKLCVGLAVAGFFVFLILGRKR